jgi:hypothetical protein
MSLEREVRRLGERQDVEVDSLRRRLEDTVSRRCSWGLLGCAATLFFVNLFFLIPPT